MTVIDPASDVAGVDPGVAAGHAAEALRMVNHLTLVAPTPGTPGWEGIGDIYRVLGELCLLAGRLPQAFDQLLGHLQRPADGSPYRSDTATTENAEALVAIAVDALEAARDDAHRLGMEMVDAQAAVSHLYT